LVGVPTSGKGVAIRAATKTWSISDVRELSINRNMRRSNVAIAHFVARRRIRRHRRRAFGSVKRVAAAVAVQVVATLHAYLATAEHGPAAATGY
jgi:hypothetical protein